MTARFPGTGSSTLPGLWYPSRPVGSSEVGSGEAGLLEQVIIPRGFLTEELDVDLLKRVDTAELVQLVVDLVEDERLVVVGSVVLHYIIHWEEGEIQDEDGRDSPYPRTQRLSLPGALLQTRGRRGAGGGAGGVGCRGGAGLGEGHDKHTPACGTRKFTTSILSK